MTGAVAVSAMDEVIRLSSTLENDWVKRWKEDGRKVVGYACLSTPPEIMDAAGLLPCRIRALGNPNTEIADSHLGRFNCSFCRSCLELGLDGSFDFLDGLIESNGCDHLRGMFENWEYVKPSEFFHYLKVPHLINKDSMRYYTEELGFFRDALVKHFGVAITSEDITNSIIRIESVRKRLREIYNMRRGQYPGFTGAEALSLFLLSSAVPVEAFNELADAAMEERRNERSHGNKIRLMLCGAATDELELIKAIEAVGAIIVTDALCYGARAFWDPVDSQKEPLAALADSYLRNLLCPRMYTDYPRRRDYVLSSVENYGVDGVILIHNKFCDVHGVDNAALRLDLEKREIPVLQIEKDYGSQADVGRIRTRVQALLEKIS